eukprot:TRINITY_DN25881_c0_g1_i1.p1 TRINITY_DN25881_c0_g1~~TRINITY_DN25881_c0_g1_i1.p1  ORF type:complete len:372 (-),score=58.12 TRINITY_DN25881_c0_g1_i1:60-1175(-)
MGCGGSVEKRYSPCDSKPATDTRLVTVSENGQTEKARSFASAPGARACRVPEGVVKLNMRNFQILQALTETQHSPIHCLLDRVSKRVVAGKRFLAGGRSKPPRQGLDLEFENEVQMLHRLSKSPYVVSILGVGSFGERVVLLELCAGGTLDAWLKLCPTAARDAALQLLQAVEGLHRQSVCHLALQPGHILFDDTGRLQLCDFAMARQFETASESKVLGNLTSSASNNFQAPELSSGMLCCGFLADIFSLGMLLQTIARADATWKVALGSFQALAAHDPSQRTSTSAVLAEIFPTGGAGRKGAGSAGVSQAEKNMFELNRMLLWDPEANPESPRPRLPTRKPMEFAQSEQRTEKKPALHQKPDLDLYRPLN